MLAFLFSWGAHRNSRLANPDHSKSDQGAYIDYAIRLAETDRSWVGNRNQMPLVPMLQSIFHRPGMSEAEFFETGKRVNIAFALLACLVVGWLGARSLPGHAAVNFALIATFCHLVFRAPYFKAEVLYYLFVFMAFLVALRALRSPGLGWGLWFGLFCAIAHYCKASTQPLMAAFVGVMALRAAGDALRCPAPGGRVRRCLPPLLCALFAVVTFLALLAPYLLNSKRVYGRYFYNVNSTFYVWYDSWSEVKRGTRAAGDRVGWPKLPPDQIPSARKYFREHTVGQIAARQWAGMRLQIKNLVGAHGSFKYLALAFAAAGLMAWRNRTLLRAWAHPHRWPMGFAAAYLSLSFLAISWYSILADGSRFVMALYLPLLFSGFWLATHLPDTQVTLAGRTASLRDLLQRVVTAILGVEIPFNLLVRLTDEFGGA